MNDEEFEEYANANPIADEDIVEGDPIEPEPEEVEEEQEELEVIEPEEVQDEEVAVEEDTEAEVEVTEEEETEEDIPETLEAEAETGTEDTQETVDEVVDEYDYKAGMSQIMAPIKANGQEIQIKSPEDARTLIQKGLNYDEKMVSIKPVRLAGKALERAGVIKDGVVDEVALNRMIDFNNGDVELIKERLKELKIDPLDLDLDEVDYQAQDYIPDEHSVVLDDIQRELDNRGTTGQVVDAINHMDSGSKDYFTQNPQQLLGLETDIANGVFDEINQNVQYERRMGRLAGKTDMEAYIEFAQARGQMMAQQEQQPTQAAPVKKVDAKKRQKAGGSKPAASTKVSEAVNPFELSDEEFEKQFGSAQALR